MGKFDIENMQLYYDDFHAIKNVSMSIRQMKSLHLSVLQDVVNLH